MLTCLEFLAGNFLTISYIFSNLTRGELKSIVVENVLSQLFLIKYEKSRERVWQSRLLRITNNYYETISDNVENVRSPGL